MASQRRRPAKSSARPGAAKAGQARPHTAKAVPAKVDPAPEMSLDTGGVPPPPGASYLGILRGESFVWWRSLLGVVFSLSLFLLLVSLVSQLVISLAWSTTRPGVTYADYFRQAAAFERPSGMLGAHLGIMTLILISAAMMLVVHQVRPRWLLSVQARVRWSYLLVCMGVAAVALGAMLWLSTLFEDLPDITSQPDFWLFLVVIILTSPLQAVAEEVYFRGYLLQALGSVVASPWFGIVVSSMIFAYVHGSQNLALFGVRLGFGLLAATLVRVTGGLEAGIAAHVVNNVLTFVVAGLTTTIAGAMAISSITLAQAVLNVGGFAVFAVLAYLVGRRMRLQTRVELADWRGPRSSLSPGTHLQ